VQVLLPNVTVDKHFVANPSLNLRLVENLDTWIENGSPDQLHYLLGTETQAITLFVPRF
jgi:hypothetical protein